MLSVISLAMLAAGCGPSKEGTAGATLQHTRSSRTAVNPSVPQSGGLSAATKWLRDNAQYQPMPIPGGDLLFSSQGLPTAIYVNSKTGKWVMLPGFTASSFERETKNGGLLFLVQGPGGESSLIPFPFQWLLTPRTDGTFAARLGPMYFPVATGVNFGSKPNAMLNSIAVIKSGIEIGFGPEPGDPGAFFADYTSAPPTEVTYDGPSRTLIFDFSQTRLSPITFAHSGLGVTGPVSSVGAVKSPYIERVSAVQTPSGVDVEIALTSRALYYSGKIVVAPKTQLPYLQILLANRLPAPPWGP